jgi:hypothetical protein
MIMGDKFGARDAGISRCHGVKNRWIAPQLAILTDLRHIRPLQGLAQLLERFCRIASQKLRWEKESYRKGSSVLDQLMLV